MIRKLRPALLLPDIGGLFALITFIVLCLFSAGRALNDGDTFWHIAAGQRMLADRIILTSDVFSHTAAGKAWTAHEWLAEIVMAAVHSFSGLPGVCIFFFLITSLSFWLLYIVTQKESSGWFAFIFVTLAFVLSFNHLLARPHIFTWFLGGLTFFTLRKQGKILFILPFISALWANLHGGFILGLVLQGIFIASNYFEYNFSLNLCSLKKWTIEQKIPICVFLLSIGAVGINPFGLSLYLFPFQVSSNVFAQGINEWLSPDFQKQWLFRLFLLFSIFLLSQRNISTTWRDRFFLLFFINAALVHQRHISIAAFYLTPFLAKATQIWTAPIISSTTCKREISQRQLILSKWTGPIGAIILSILFLFLSSPLSPRTKTFFEKINPVSRNRFPVDAVNFLEKKRPKGNIFNQYSWGGYIIYALTPPQPVFIDGRADMYGEKIFKNYQSIVNLDSSIDELLKEYEIDWIFYPLDSKLIRHLKSTGQWIEVYSDDLAAILKRAEL